jgi:hypothetical protein
MTQLSTKIKLYANQEVDFNKDVLLQDDSNGKGAYIKEWNLSIAQPTTAQLDALESKAQAKEVEVQADYDAKQYQRDRVYPSIGDQLDMLWHSIDQNPALKSQYFDFYEAIKAVKVKNPKNG